MPFVLLRQAPAPHINATFFEFSDSQSGARHFHLQTDSEESSFMVTFPTAANTDDGRAHILEHLCLCGSARYPGRDPFFAMTRRSLATYMNALTGQDFTAYPFATLDPADFQNLLSVYLDATFFPKLDRLDFLQEGWRHEFEPDGSLAYNGIVLNEMREPISDPQNPMLRAIHAALTPGSSGSWECGGDPASIPSLTLDELRLFHSERCHPSLATFWSHGPIDPHAIQARIEQDVLPHFPEALSLPEHINPKPISTPTSIEVAVPSDGAPDEHSLYLSWHVGNAADDHEGILAWQLFSEAIGSDDSSPMIAAIEKSGMGQVGACGTDAPSRATIFHIGIEGLLKNQLQPARDLVLATLARIASDGLPPERLESSLRSFEIYSLEISGDDMPHGLELLYSMAQADIYGGDPLRAADLRAEIELARLLASAPDFTSSMAAKLLANPSRVECRTRPERSYMAKRDRAESRRLATLQASLSPAQTEAISRDSADLLLLQRATPDHSELPRISPKDIPRAPRHSPDILFDGHPDGPSTAFVASPTNGIGYLSISMDASASPASDWPWLSLGAEIAFGLGCGPLNFHDAAIFRAALADGYGSEFFAHPGSSRSGSSIAPTLKFSCKGLETDAASMADGLCKSFSGLRFDELDRISFLIQARHQNIIISTSQQGGHLAACAARAPLGAHPAFDDLLGGSSRISFSEEIDALSRTASGLTLISSKLISAFRTLSTAPLRIDYIGTQDHAHTALSASRKLLPQRRGSQTIDAVDQPISDIFSTPANLAISGAGQLNYCHAAWPAPKIGNPDAGALRVLAALMTNAFLHRTVREEGGAYGVGASYDPISGIFSINSERDPRLAGTFADFQSAIAFAVDGAFSSSDIDEAILTIIQASDTPGSPLAAAEGALAQAVAGISSDCRARLREDVLTCQPTDIQEAASRHLLGVPPSRAACVRPKSSDEANKIGLLASHPQSKQSPRGHR